MTIRCLLIEPNPSSALNEEAAKLQLDDFAAFRQRAALMTRLHGNFHHTVAPTQCPSLPPTSAVVLENSSTLLTQKPISIADHPPSQKKKSGLRRL